MPAEVGWGDKGWGGPQAAAVEQAFFGRSQPCGQDRQLSARCSDHPSPACCTSPQCFRRNTIQAPEDPFSSLPLMFGPRS